MYVFFLIKKKMAFKPVTLYDKIDQKTINKYYRNIKIR